MHLLLRLVVRLQLLTLASAFPSIKRSSPAALHSKNDIQVSIVRTKEAIASLADLRYEEWMSDGPNPPTMASFRSATAEIYHERRDEGEGGPSTVFLATRLGAPVGAAELSPIELRGAFSGNGDGALGDALRDAAPLYITDVVTSSAHRRLGIGSTLMNAVETTARGLGSRFAFLHVEHDNAAAMQFYERLGYVEVEDATTIIDGTSEEDSGILSFDLGDGGLLKGSLIDMDVNRIAVNAGTVGQLLMVKRLSSSTGEELHSIAQSLAPTDSSVSAQGGFGTRKGNRKKKKRKR